MPVLGNSDLIINAHEPVLDLSSSSSLEEEIDAMVASLQMLEPELPDVMIATCMAYMARCTELYVNLIRVEHRMRWAKSFRTLQLQKVMELIEFMYRGASRLVESRRQEVEMSR